jgi:ATP-dependent helicase/nuclease subunit B
VSGFQRVFLGWNSAFLPNCAAHLLEQYGPDLSQVQIALPGRRAGRRLQELLLEQAPASWAPPQTTTLGQLSDRLTTQSLPCAPELLRDLTWVQVLQQQRKSDLEKVLAELPQGKEFSAWWPLAKTIQDLHRDLGGAMHTFAEAGQFASAAEGPRWLALTRIQQDYATQLADAGYGDPHLLRLDALRAQHLTPASGPLLLVGITEANPLQRAILLHPQVQGQALVAAPKDLADAFDELGMPIPEAWAQRQLDLANQRVHMCADPADQARKVLEELRKQPAQFAPEDITLGVLDDRSLPPLARQFAEVGVSVHGAQGQSLAQSPPARLLAALADWMEKPRAHALGQLLRHADCEEALSAELQRPSDPAALDTYLAEHVLEQAAPPWLPASYPQGIAATNHLKQQSALLWKWTEDLRGKARGARAWVDALDALLQQLYGQRELDRSREADRELASALSSIAKRLLQWRQLPQEQSSLPLAGSQALRLLVHHLRQEEIPTPQRGGGSIDAVGWLELALDDAPALLVCDMQEGLVPAAPQVHPLLEAPLRKRLGLEQDALRLARDHYLLECLCAQRQGHSWPQLFLCRNNAQGDPLLPSRLFFLGEQSTLAARALSMFGEEPDGAQCADGGLPPEPTWPRAPAMPAYEQETFSPSRINAYLQSPYTYYLRHVLGLEDVEEDPQELSALHFGNLVHEVLEQFGRHEEAPTWTDAQQLHRFLVELLGAEAKKRFGDPPRGTVGLQLQQAEYRLWRFALRQVRLVEEGWRIHAVEWSPQEDSVPLDFHGTAFHLGGRIDRIDRREHEGQVQWRIIDYKSGDKAMDLGRCVMPKKLVWRDVQMALYPHLAAPLIGRVPLEDMPQSTEVCYWNLGASDDSDAYTILDWKDGMLAAMTTQVAAAIEGIRAGNFFDTEQRPPSFDAFALRCMGQGQLVAMTDEEQGEWEE